MRIGAADIQGRDYPLVIQYNGEPMVMFYGHTEGKPGCRLSNFYPMPFRATVRTNNVEPAMWQEHNFPTSEHYLMYRKALLFGDEASAARILAAKTPASAKALGRGVKGFDEAVWARERLNIMIDGLIAKFADEPGRGYLLSTGDALLIECAPNDTVWGIGLKVGALEAFQRDKWRGLNLLGEALMAARKYLRDRR